MLAMLTVHLNVQDLNRLSAERLRGQRPTSAYRDGDRPKVSFPFPWTRSYHEALPRAHSLQRRLLAESLVAI